jgi:hypothetical protein
MILILSQEDDISTIHIIEWLRYLNMPFFRSPCQIHRLGGRGEEQLELSGGTHDATDSRFLPCRRAPDKSFRGHGQKRGPKKRMARASLPRSEAQTQGAVFTLREPKAKKAELGEKAPEVLKENITYFENNIKRMNYAQYQRQGFPIGSGLTEAACKVVAKQRLGASGMRWTIDIAQDTLLLRGLVCTYGRWNQFWNHITAKRA